MEFHMVPPSPRAPICAHDTRGYLLRSHCLQQQKPPHIHRHKCERRGGESHRGRTVCCQRGYADLCCVRGDARGRFCSRSDIVESEQESTVVGARERRDGCHWYGSSRVSHIAILPAMEDDLLIEF
jgi:hypothetical protein